MTDEPDNPVLRIIRGMDAKLDRAIAGDPADKAGSSTVGSAMAAVNRRIDRLEQRLGGIEKRLDLVDVAR